MFTLLPRFNLLLLLAILALAAWGAVGLILANVPTRGGYGWFLAGLSLGLAAALGLTVLALTKNKQVRVAQGQLWVTYPWLPGRAQRFDLAQLERWDEQVVRTSARQEFRQLVLGFPRGVVKVSNLEHSNYDKLKQLLKKGPAKSRKK
jgi:hypothetical protein